MENLLPAEIRLDIFSRLPAESVLQCRKVCKTWRTLLHHPHFADMHLRRAQQLDKVSILYLNGKLDDYEKHLYYGEFDENDRDFNERIKRISHPPVYMRDSIVGSCNGLICFSVNGKGNINDTVYICNPITREYVNLQILSNDIRLTMYLTRPLVYGFGYLPSTKEYKVVRVLYWSGNYLHESSGYAGSVEVYTLGGGNGWRNKGELKYLLSGNCYHANGALHWMDDEMKIMAFDLADEQFHVLPSPPFDVDEYEEKCFLQVLGGLLCAVHRKCDESLDIWSLVKNNSSTYDIKEREHQSWSWHRKFAILYDRVLLMRNYEPFAFTKSGKILLWYDNSHRFPDLHNHSRLFIYDPETELLDESDADLLFLQAIPHLNSFVSLKSLGEDAKFLRSAEECFERPPSRPMKSRRRDKDEAQGGGGNKKRRRCNACGGMGRNRRTCNRGVHNSS